MAASESENVNQRKRKYSDPRRSNEMMIKEEPFKDVDWSTTDFLIIRLTYFNKRKCRKFPLNITEYTQFTQFIEYYFPSLIGQKWHCENDENWIESKEDFDVICEYHIATNKVCNFLELMIVNESLPNQRIFAPKAVYFDNAFKAVKPQQIMPYKQAVPENGYHRVSYPHYLKNQSPKKKEMPRQQSTNRRMNVFADAICPNPTTYLPFPHAGQSTPQMRTLHKIFWVLQHQKNALTVDAIRSCLPGKKKAQIKEIDYLLSSYESYKYTKSEMMNGRKVWKLCSGAFPPEFWNLNWQKTH